MRMCRLEFKKNRCLEWTLSEISLMYSIRAMVDNSVIYIDICTHKYIYIAWHTHLHKSSDPITAHSCWGICPLYLSRRLSLIFTSYSWLNPQSELTDGVTLTWRIFFLVKASGLNPKLGGTIWKFTLVIKYFVSHKINKNSSIKCEHTHLSALWTRGEHKVILSNSWTFTDNMTNQDRIRNTVLWTALNSSLKLHWSRLTHSWREDKCIQTHSASTSILIYHNQPSASTQVPPPSKKTTLL